MKRKIAFYLSSDGFGGLELNALNLASWMNEEEREVHLFISDNERMIERAKELSIQYHIVKHPNKYIDIAEGLRMSKRLKKLGISDMIIFDNHDLSTANFCKQFFYPKLKMIYLQQMQFKVSKKSIFHTFRFSGLNYWIAPLPSLKEQVLRTTRVPEKKIKIIPLSLVTSRFTENKITREQAREELKIDKEVFLMGVLGRIAPTKGQLHIIQAFHQLSKAHPNARLLIMGEPTINEEQCVIYNEDCHKYVKENALEDLVYFRPFRKEVEYFYSATNLFIMASKKETFGMVTVEAMLSGIPVIGTNAGGTPELLEGGQLGQLYSFQNIEEVKEKMENVLLEKYNYKEQVIKAKASAESRYGHKNMLNSILSLFE